MDKKALRQLQKAVENAPEPDERNVALGRALGEMVLAEMEFIGDFYTDAGLERIMKMTDEEHQEDLDRRSKKHSDELDRIMKKYSPKKDPPS